MTEAEWLAESDPVPIFAALADGASPRKCTLFCVGCCRLQAREANLDAVAGRTAREWRAAEQYADGLIARDVLWEVWCGHSLLGTLAYFPPPPPLDPRLWARNWARRDFGSRARPSVPPDAVARMIREVFSNPFRPAARDPSWLTSTVVALADGIYADRAFDRMPILADALMDAGCHDEQVLGHCRGPGPHVRGCWVVDLVLGKE